MPSPRPAKDAPVVALPLALCLSVFALLLAVAVHGSGHDRRPTVHCPVKPTATRTAPPSSSPCPKGTAVTVPGRTGTPAARRPGSDPGKKPAAPRPVQPPRKQPAAPKAPPAAPKPVQPAPPRPAIG